MAKKIVSVAVAVILAAGSLAGGSALYPATAPPPAGAAGPLAPHDAMVALYYNPKAPEALAAAKAVQKTFDNDYKTLAGPQWFGVQIPIVAGSWSGFTRQLPAQVYTTSGINGASHPNCASTQYTIENDPTLAPGLAVAELAESFQAAKGNGWDCGKTNGEALSRVASYILHPALAADAGWSSPQFSWWQDGHKDYVNTNVHGDTDFDADGCGVLFLYYLRDQLGFTMNQIINAGRSTLGQTYQALMASRGIQTTGQQGFKKFVNLLSTIQDGPGSLNLPPNGNPHGTNPPVPFNPFPILSASA